MIATAIALYSFSKVKGKVEINLLVPMVVDLFAWAVIGSIFAK